MFTLTLLAFASTGGASLLERVEVSVLAVAGVAVFAFIVCGVALMNTDLEQVHARQKVRPQAMYLCMLLDGLYAANFYIPSTWGRVVSVVLFLMLASAIWQMVRDRLPYLLDPTQSPPPRLSLAVGLVTAFAFFAIQSAVMLILVRSEMSLGNAVLWAYVVAGLLVTVVALVSLRRVPDLLRAVGLRGGPGRPGIGRAALAGLAGGASAGCVGIVYTWVLSRTGWPRALQEQAPDLLSSSQNALPLVPLAVLAAPACEQFIFRGLILGGRKRVTRPVLAVGGSALVFAIVHPPVSVVPVFGLGLAAGIVFWRTRLLIAPILAHMTYNVLVLVAVRWL